MMRPFLVNTQDMKRIMRMPEISWYATQSSNFKVQYN